MARRGIDGERTGFRWGIGGATWVSTRAKGRCSACLPSDGFGRYKRCMSQLNDKRKQSLYFTQETLREIQEEAIRQDRSLSWVVQHAWKLARERLSKMPSVRNSMPPKNTEG